MAAYLAALRTSSVHVLVESPTEILDVAFDSSEIHLREPRSRNISRAALQRYMKATKTSSGRRFTKTTSPTLKRKKIQSDALYDP